MAPSLINFLRRTVDLVLLLPNQLIRTEYLDDSKFWNSMNHSGGIEPPSGALAAAHYGFTGGLIAKIFAEQGHYPKDVLDIGSGTGRWLDWYKKEFDSRVAGIEISEMLAEQSLEQGHNIICGDVAKVLAEDTRRYDTINAIGVMHHILPDEKRISVLRECVAHLLPGGLMIVGGFFCPWQVQYATGRGEIYKRCWSLTHWKRVMIGCRLRVYRNPICRWRRLPQNNILLIQKGLRASGARVRVSSLAS